MIVDNLEYVNYRVGYTASKMGIFDRFVWVAGDAKQVALLEDKAKAYDLGNVDIVNANHKIKNGADFAALQDFSYKHISANYDYDVLAFISADELLSDFGATYLADWIDLSPEKFCVFFGMSNKLFIETHLDPIVFQVIRKGVEYRSNEGLSDNLRYCNGKAITDNKHYFNLGKGEDENKNLIIDLGYINPLACYQKMINWGRLCYGSPQKKHLVELYEAGNIDGFITTFIDYHRAEFHGATDKSLTPFRLEGEYLQVIQELDILKDYNQVANLVSAKV